MPAFELLTAAVSDDDHLPLGSSRLGGRPDLPPGEPWPAPGGWPLSFIVQIDLATVDTGGVLPPDGLLSFFYDAVEQPWGFEEGDELGTVLRWTPPGTPLQRRDFPPELDDDDGVFRPTWVAIAAVDEDDDRAYPHRLLGRPDEIQEELGDRGRLVLQIGADDDAGMSWGDGGALYVLLPGDSLERREWHRARTFVDSY